MRSNPPSDTKAEQQTDIVDEGSLHKYRTEIPNTVVKGQKGRGLSVYAKWLYVYLKSVAGDSGKCTQGTTTIAAGAGMSRGQVSAAKVELLTAHLITLQKGKNINRNPDCIRIKDIWLVNMQEFASVHNMNTEGIEERQQSPDHKHVSVHNTNTIHASVHNMNTNPIQCSQYEPGVHNMNERRSLEEDLKKENCLPSEDSCGDGEKLTSPPTVSTGINGHAPPGKKTTANPWLQRSTWEATDEGEFYDLLTTQQHLWQDPAFVLDGDWWHALDTVYGTWLTLELLRREFAKMTAHFLTPGEHRPVKSGGWKRLLRSWLDRTHRYEARERSAQRRITHASQ